MSPSLVSDQIQGLNMTCSTVTILIDIVISSQDGLKTNTICWAAAPRKMLRQFLASRYTVTFEIEER